MTSSADVVPATFARPDCSSVIIDGHEILPLPNGSYYVLSGSQKTYHPDYDAAVRHVTRLAERRAAYEARRIAYEGGR